MAGEGRDHRRWESVLGCVADDLTGATDLASAIRRAGLRVRLCIGVPDVAELAEASDTDAVVVALPIRSVAPALARELARASAEALAEVGVTTFYYKYCSTFDSTPEGNIGPVVDELLDLLSVDSCIHAPSYPENGRTVYQGHLFIGSVPLAESPMRHHPRTPMTDSNLVRVLSHQTARPVSLMPLAVAQSSETGATDLRGHVIADAVRDEDIHRLAGLRLRPLAAGGAPFGAAIASQLAQKVAGAPAVCRRGRSNGRRAVVVGSASTRTRVQVEEFAGPIVRLPARGGEELTLREATRQLASGPVLVAAPELRDDEGKSVAPPPEDALDVERRLAWIAAGLVAAGVDRLVVAGGETSGAVADALGLRSAIVGPEIAPGVPWTFSEDGKLAVAFKSGNFGAPSFFGDAFDELDAWENETC